MSNAVIILAAGRGSRMQSDLPKVLHKLAGAPLLVHTMQSSEALQPEHTIIITGYGADAVENAAKNYNPTAIIVEQNEQLGTGHAVDQAKSILANFDGNIFILYGDTPFIKAETLQAMQVECDNGASVVVLGFNAKEPGRYGRLILAKDGSLDAIIEAKDASPEQLAISFSNSGVICASRKTLFELLSNVDNNNASQEYYLTDIVALARKKGLSCIAVECCEAETMGVNSRIDLSIAEAQFQNIKRRETMENGATLLAPETVFFSYDTYIGRDVNIEQNVIFSTGVTIESGAYIRAFSHLEGCHVSKGAIIGPYARLRPGAEIGDKVKVGNFVEVKSSIISEGAKINHLSYIGDAEIGKNTNIGAGTIICNYDGVFKHKTIIGERAFIGSNSSLIAPLRIGNDAMTGSGSVITKDIPDTDLGLGRAKQVNKTGLALRLMSKLKTAKATKNKGT